MVLIWWSRGSLRYPEPLLGSHRIITTTQNNIKARRIKIPPNEFSSTFRDAIAVTRALDLQYLWIDSFCIVQDSTNDWELESSDMGNYYAAAEVTIAATDAQDSSIGCFVERNPHSIQPCRLDLQLVGAGDKLTVITHQIDDHRARTGELNRRPDRTSRLDSRAWCLQERIMSSRILSFGQLEMDWICNSRRIFEGQIKQDVTVRTYSADCFRTLHNHKLLLAAHGARCKNNIWFDIVEQYTRRNLTYISDMLPGLSGITSQIQCATRDEYLAGIWQHDLARDLLWRTPNQIVLKSSRDSETPYDEQLATPFATRISEYRAPSWSWASIGQGWVNWDHVRELASLDGETIVGIDADADKHAEACFEVLRTAIDLQGRNPYGQVRDGTLQVRGLLKRVEVRAGGDDIEGNIEGSYFHDFSLIDPDVKTVIGRVDVDVGDWVVGHLCAFPDNKEELETICLALTPAESRPGYFSRVGIATVKEKKWFADCRDKDLTII